MSEEKIRTSRGIDLAGELVTPVDSKDAVVIFAHSFLADRHQSGWFDLFAKTYRAAGFATMQLDLSGSGASDDDILCIENQVDDLKAVSTWLNKRGLTRQVIHAHGWGALSALAAFGYTTHEVPVQALILSAPLLGPTEVNWEEVFSEQQISELESTSHTLIPNDEDPIRDHFVISKQTLKDLSTIDTSEVLKDMTLPTLFVADETTLGSQWFAPIMDDPSLLSKQQCELVVLQNLILDSPPDGQTTAEDEDLEAKAKNGGESSVSPTERVRAITGKWLTRTVAASFPRVSRNFHPKLGKRTG